MQFFKTFSDKVFQRERVYCSEILQISFDRIRLREQIQEVIFIKKRKMIFLADAKLHFDFFFVSVQQKNVPDQR